MREEIKERTEGWEKGHDSSRIFISEYEKKKDNRNDVSFFKNILICFKWIKKKILT